MKSKTTPILNTDLPFTIDNNGNNAFVGRSFGFTLNLGNFESLRCDTSVSVPCYPDTENMNKALTLAEEIVTKESIESLDYIKSNTEVIRKALHERIEGSTLVNE